ncbi:maltase-glucoamylase-like [Littorina saxatilis]|uniref:maltase-glucoamylase-like n=1 Tax=Littorina saxatilis TaxID=31220 RepID=UPI0038B59388
MMTKAASPAGLGLLIVLTATFFQVSRAATEVRHDCFPDAGSPHVTLSEAACRQRNCDWDSNVPEGQPWCVLSRAHGVSYSLSHRTDQGSSLQVDLQRRGAASYGGDFARPTFRAEFLSDSVVRFTFDDSDAQPPRYRVPMGLNLPSSGASSPLYQLKITSTDPFAFQIIRRDTGTVILDTSVGGLILSDQYLQLATRLPSGNVYGFGENLHNSFRHPIGTHPSLYSAFSRDIDPRLGKPLYGVQPFYTCVEDSQGNTHGVFLLNSNAQDFSLSSDPMLTWRTIGGVLDFFVFLGPSPENVVQQYTQLVGLPVMPPYWGLGFQLCKWGYNNLDNMKRAVSETINSGIPLDVQYADIDHMDERKDFTLDTVHFAGLNDYWQSLRTGGMRTVIILDPCLAKVDGYEPYEKMKQVRGNIQWPRDATPDSQAMDSDRSVLGKVWPDPKVVFPDFFKNVTRQTWKDLIVSHRSKLVFDGLWIDMNEPSNFMTNENRPGDWKPVAGDPLHCLINKWDDPPYRPLAVTSFDTPQRAARMSDKTMCMNAVQGNSGEHRHYDVHSLYAWSQASSTQEAARAATGERSMVITRSNFAGSGQYAGHWLGDNHATWDDLHQSIIGMLEFNLFGIPFIGADICGFNGHPSDELCLRWMQLGAFYPFSRNHNTAGNHEQHPGHFGQEFTSASREILETRYWMLPYLYTLFHHAHTEGGTVVRPLHHEFPTDSATLGIDRQFLWGPGFLISPILEQGQSTLQFYVPEGRWYDFYQDTVFIGPKSVTIPVYYYSKPQLLLRGGHIFPLQRPANNTAFSRRNPFSLKVMLSDQETNGGKANGTLFWDDGTSQDTFEKGNYFYAAFTAHRGLLTMKVKHNHGVPEINTLHVENIEIHGVVEVDDVSITSQGRQITSFKYDFTEDTEILILHVTLPLADDFTVEWSSDGSVTPIVYPPVASQVRVDCYPEAVSPQGLFNQENCQNRHCAYDEHVPQGEPFCFYPLAGGLRYSLESRENTANGFRVGITRYGQGPFGKDFRKPTLEVQVLSNDMLRFTFDDAAANPARYRVPVPLNLPQGPANNPQYVFHFTDESRLAFQIIRKSTGTAIFDTGVGGLVLSDQFLQLATKLPSRNVYGLGENVHDSFRHQSGKSWAAFARDQPPTDLVYNLYGAHAFYTCVEDDSGNTHGVFMFNSNAQEYVLGDLPMLTWRTIGGVLDFFVFLGPSPENVVQQYTQVIGRPVMPPYWGLGFQLCEYHYNTLAHMQTAVRETLQYNIPLDVQYADIDHMEGRRDFTVDPVTFAGLNDYWKSLRAGGMHTIIILDPALISNVSGYEPYEKIKSVNGFVSWSSDVTSPADSRDSSGAMLGYVWPQGKVAFPDFFKNVTRQAWKELIVKHHERLAIDGLWIDMNEPANFGTNDDRPFNWPENVRPYWSLKCPRNELDDPMYRTLGAYAWDTSDHRARLSDKTLCMSAVQGNSHQYRHYDVHNLYGYSETTITLEAIRAATGERGLVISRSTFPGSGHYAGHWLGDNFSSWTDLRRSIIGMLEFNLFGIPMVGADICGFQGATTKELCLRWMQLGAFYPFSRNHNSYIKKPQHPGAFGPEFGQASREIMEVRYWLLPYLYTLFHLAHTQGGTVARPLHHEFPTDVQALAVDQQFMWGPALLISPILNQGEAQLQYYLPTGRWYDFFTGVSKQGPSQEISTVTYYSKPALHVRAGHILPTQRPANNTVFSRRNPLTIRAMLDAGGQASGSLYWDDGTSIETYTSGNYFLADFSCKNGLLQMKVRHSHGVADANSLYVEAVAIYGVGPTSRITVSNSLQSHMSYTKTYNTAAKVLQLKDLHLPLQNGFTITWN